MTQDKTGPDATPRIGLDLGRQIFDDSNGTHEIDQPSSAGEESIRLRAYEIWESEGRAGDPHDHWYRAERELKSQPEQSSAMVRNAPPAAAVEVGGAVTEQFPGGEVVQKKPRRKRTS